MNTRLLKTLFLFTLVIFIQSNITAQTGTWTALTNHAPNGNMGVMLLLTDGTVICHNEAGGTDGTGWDKLTPNSNGSYINGTWTTVASMHTDRLFFSSQVMTNGKVFVAGGEYSGGVEFPTNIAGEVYDPLANTWTVTGAVPPGWSVADANSEILDNGRILEGPQGGANPSFDCLFYTPSTNLFTTAPSSIYNHDEAQWLKLPDSSILFVGIASTNSNRYIAKTNSWVNDGTLPVHLYDQFGEEAGPAFMLPNGKAVFFGATPHNAIYTPSGNSSAGTWTAAADFPTIGGTSVGMPDAAGAMMVNGHILCAVSPIGTGSNDEFRSPIYFVDYNYTTNTFTQVTITIPGFGADSIAGGDSYLTNMLALPDGNILFSIAQNGITQYWEYTPGSAAIAAGKPTIDGIIPGSCPSYKLRGKLFNGISEGAAYGDDWRMATNYPIIRLTNGANVYYAKTTNWNRIGAVQTDSLEDTVTFTPPSALPAGTYSLVVVANGIASNPTILKTLSSSITSTTNVPCNGGTGSLTVTATGGVAPYTYSWTNGGGSNATASTITANSYTVTVTDAGGCTTTASATITQPTALGITMSSHTNPRCNGGTGSATANPATGGTSPYTYAWTPSGGTGLTASNLTANTYTITATDNHGCVASATATITQPIAFSTTATVTANVNCNGSNTGNASASPSNGTAPYTYTWSNGTSTVSTSNPTGAVLLAGGYTVTVQDNCGASQSVVVTITQPVALSTTATVTANVNCNGGNTGNASASPSGGNVPYTYSWSNGTSTVSTANPTGAVLTAGSYTVTVHDNCGASKTASVSISQPAAMSTTASVIANVGCAGGNTGNANATPSNGNLPYTYSWSNGTSTVSTSNPTGTILPAGGYTVTVRDNCGASQTASVVITQPVALTATASVTTNVGCRGGNTGNASASPSNGTAPYTYSWSNGTSTVSTSNPTGTILPAGGYTVTVRDNCGASKTASVTITQPGVLSTTASVVSNVSCNSGGNASASPSSGTAPYTYSWSNGTSTVSTSNPTGAVLNVGSYTVTVHDNCGATATAHVSITQTNAVVASWWSIYNVSCFGGSNGKVISTVYGGTTPYTYSWSNGQTTGTASNLTAGSYTLTVTDKNGCTGSNTITLTQPASRL